jgi:RNA polymerase II-associated protein 1
MSIRGQRFHVDFSDDDDDVQKQSSTPQRPSAATPISLSLVADVVERDPAAVQPPTAPALKKNSTGFPEHKKLTRLSAFRQQRAPATKSIPTRDAEASTQKFPSQASTGLRSQQDGAFEEIERRRIDQENRQRLAAMSKDEIEQEQKELLAHLDPSLIERLLKRANLDEGRGDTGIEKGPARNGDSHEIYGVTANEVGYSAAVPLPQPTIECVSAAKTVRFDDDDEPADPGILQPVSNFTRAAAALSDPHIHFPTAPSAPDLDPSDPSFLENLHKKYFPSLPADPSKLAWMAPVPTHGSPADQESPYYPAQKGLAASALRFDFRGGLLPPRIARAVPVTKGLHHHGEAPEAAGYTVPELARLARSAFPAQRCVAFQTLGRLLYRLGRGEWGDDGSEIATGLWKCVDQGKVIDTLEEAAAAEGGHQGSKAYAIEALWLWQKGGGQRWKSK